MAESNHGFERFKTKLRAEHESTRKNAAGFSLIGLLVGLPLFLSLLFGVIAMGQNLTLFTRWESHCLHLIYSTFDQVSQTANDLLRLNPKASLLRTKHRMAKARLLAALASGNPALILTRERQLAHIKMQQVQLGQKQQLLLRQISFEYSRLNVKIQSRFVGKEPLLKMPEFAIRPDLPKDIAPIYVVPRDLHQQNRTDLTYRLNSFPKSCAMTIEQRGSYVRASLTE